MLTKQRKARDAAKERVADTAQMIDDIAVLGVKKAHRLCLDTNPELEHIFKNIHKSLVVSERRNWPE